MRRLASAGFSGTAMKTCQCSRARNRAPDRSLSDRSCSGVGFTWFIHHFGWHVCHTTFRISYCRVVFVVVVLFECWKCWFVGIGGGGGCGEIGHKSVGLSFGCCFVIKGHT